MKPSGQQRDWDDLARLDPLWAILEAPAKRFGGWSAHEFFATGQTEVGDLLDWAERHQLPQQRRKVVDFGCGVGRLSRALAPHFETCLGVDISPAMVAQARRLNRNVRNLGFEVSPNGQLRGEMADLIVTLAVLQHLPNEEQILTTTAALAGLVSVGGALIIGVPNYIPIRHRFQPRRHLYSLLRAIGAHPKALYNRLGLMPIRMRAVGDADICNCLAASGMTIVDVRRSTHPSGVRSAVYLAARRDRVGDPSVG